MQSRLAELTIPNEVAGPASQLLVAGELRRAAPLLPGMPLQHIYAHAFNELLWVLAAVTVASALVVFGIIPATQDQDVAMDTLLDVNEPAC